MAPENLPFAEDELVVDEDLGYPKAYAELCGDASLRSGAYAKGPPFAFYPFALDPHELMRAKDLNKIFPIIDPEAKPSSNPNNYINQLWKQLSHLGNAGFDPSLFRVDAFGNVLYFYADHASPLSWDIDHWFPCSRGGRTVLSNLRLLQWQVRKKKHNRLEFLIPWWDLQLGVSVNQFLSIFASKNLDFRKRAFSFLFAEGENEELNEMQTVESHEFPLHFIEKKRQLGLAPAAIVLSQKQHGSSVLKPLSLKTKRSSLGEDVNGIGITPISRSSMLKENENPNIDNPYLSIALARDSLRQRDKAKKIQGEIDTLEDEMTRLKHRNDNQRIALQDLEMTLTKKRKRVEKSRRLAEAQSSYKELLEKMIRDAMHQNVVYKEQLRLNQAATSALIARLEAQRAMCDSSEIELLKKHKQKGEIEKEIRSSSETARKRSRVDDALFEDRKDEASCSFPVNTMIMRPTRKELRKFLEEEQRAYEAEVSMIDAQGEDIEKEEPSAMCITSGCRTKEPRVNVKHKKLVLEEGTCSMTGGNEQFSISPGDQETDLEVGRGNVEKWLRVFLENAQADTSSPEVSPPQMTVKSGNQTKELVQRSNSTNPLEEIRSRSSSEDRFDVCKATGREGNTRHGMSRSSSMGNLRSRPSSPSLIPAMSCKLFKTRDSATKKSTKLPLD